MQKSFMFVLISLFVLVTGCNRNNQQDLIKTKTVQDAAHNMAKNETFQKAFSDGRIHVMENVSEAKRSILQNTVREQKMMLGDPQLSEQFLALNINTNQLMTDSPPGKEQLMQSTLKVMDGITKDANKLHSFVQIQNESRKKAMKDEKLLNQILQQNIQEQYLALNDKVLKSTMLKQNVQAFSDISTSPSLRPEMANAMLPLLKDPKIANELENMIKLAVAKETQKLQAKIQQLQKMQQSAGSAAEDKKQNNHSKKINPSPKEPDDDKQQSETGSKRPDEAGVNR